MGVARLGRPAGVGQPGTVDAAALGVAAEHHLGMHREILVDLDDAAPQVAAAQCRRRAVIGLQSSVSEASSGASASSSLHLVERHPGGTGRRLAFGAALEDQDVDHDLGAGGCAHAALGQADRAEQVGHAGDVLARRPARLVHRPGAGHEDGDAARPEAADRAGDEVVVQPQAEGGGGGIAAHDAVGEGRVADREIEARAEPAARVILAVDAGFRMDRAGRSAR